MNIFSKLFPLRHDRLNEELQTHLALATQDRIASGESPEVARAAAMRELGNMPLIADVTANQSPWRWFDSFGRDLGYACRQLRNSPGFALTAILTLALAIGANTAVFTVVHAILLNKLPFDHPERVLALSNPDGTGLTFDLLTNQSSAFEAAVSSFHTIETATRYDATGVNVVFNGEGAHRLKVTEGTAHFFDVLGVKATLGRTFVAGEDVEGKDQLVLLSDHIWRGELNSDPAVVGKDIRLNGKFFTVLSVLPPTMDFPVGSDLWTPTILDQRSLLRESGAFMPLYLVRLKPGFSLTTALDELKTRTREQVERDRQAHEQAHRAIATGKMADGSKIAIASIQTGRPASAQELTPLSDQLTSGIRSSLWMLTGAVGFVLLIACANLAGLMLARTAQRRSELAVRAALGASRLRLMQQQLVESSLVALIGALLGIAVAYGCLQLLYTLRPAALIAFARPSVEPGVLGFTAFIAVFTGLGTGLIPAWLAGRQDPLSALQIGLWRATRPGTSLRKFLVTTELAIAFVLLIGAGLLVRTLINTERVPLGYNVRNIITVSTALHGGSYQQTNKSVAVTQFDTRVLQNLRNIPGVSNVAAVSTYPLDRRMDMGLGARNEDAQSSPIMALSRIASPDYFGVMGIPLLKGRDFSSQDTATNRRVVIITDDLATKLWPGQNPLGHTLNCMIWCSNEGADVIGVIPTSRRFGPRSESEPELYVPYTQFSWDSMTFVLRTPLNPDALLPSVRQAVASVDSSQPIFDVATMRDHLNDNESLIRFELFALGSFSVLAVLLVVIGLYGLISYSVAQRIREIGLRIALGAPRSVILWGVFYEGARICLVGTVTGIISSLGLTRLLRAVLFGVTPHDPVTLIEITVLFAMIVFVASYIPARRAADIDPMQALRAE